MIALVKVTVDVNKEDLDYYLRKYGYSSYEVAVSRIVELRIKESRLLDERNRP